MGKSSLPTLATTVGWPWKQEQFGFWNIHPGVLIPGLIWVCFWFLWRSDLQYSTRCGTLDPLWWRGSLPTTMAGGVGWPWKQEQVALWFFVVALFEFVSDCSDALTRNDHPDAESSGGEFSTHDRRVALKAGTGCSKSELSPLYYYRPPAPAPSSSLHFPLFSTHLSLYTLPQGAPRLWWAATCLLRWRPELAFLALFFSASAVRSTTVPRSFFFVVVYHLWKVQTLQGHPGELRGPENWESFMGWLSRTGACCLLPLKLSAFFPLLSPHSPPPQIMVSLLRHELFTLWYATSGLAIPLLAFHSAYNQSVT